mmetsp:Transcript_59812/g.140987  ORF Transcript_59812/g.140987 Transcript_59812/m.140987 type:complete len:315 (+) Transcript_59812:344-1288(+)
MRVSTRGHLSGTERFWTTRPASSSSSPGLRLFARRSSPHRLFPSRRSAVICSSTWSVVRGCASCTTTQQRSPTFWTSMRFLPSVTWSSSTRGGSSGESSQSSLFLLTLAVLGVGIVVNCSQLCWRTLSCSSHCHGIGRSTDTAPCRAFWKGISKARTMMDTGSPFISSSPRSFLCSFSFTLAQPGLSSNLIGSVGPGLRQSWTSRVDSGCQKGSSGIRASLSPRPSSICVPRLITVLTSSIFPGHISSPTIRRSPSVGCTRTTLGLYPIASRTCFQNGRTRPVIRWWSVVRFLNLHLEGFAQLFLCPQVSSALS